MMCLAKTATESFEIKLPAIISLPPFHRLFGIDNNQRTIDYSSAVSSGLEVT